MHLYNLSTVSLTKFIILLCIEPTVKLASFSASTCAHWLEGLALLCIITPKSFPPQSLSSPEKTHTGRQRDHCKLLFGFKNNHFSGCTPGSTLGLVAGRMGPAGRTLCTTDVGLLWVC